MFTQPHWIALTMTLTITTIAAAQDTLSDRNRLIDEQYPDHPQKVAPLAPDPVIVARSTDPQNVYIYDPYVLALADGRLIGGYSFGGSKSGDYCKEQGWVGDDGEALNGAVVISDDHGLTWRTTKRFRIWHERAFEAGGRLYILGHHDDLLIMCSDDRGETWADPVKLTDGQVWHQSAVGYWKTDTHVYIVMERRDEDRKIKGWPVANIAPVLMRAPLDADLTKRESWTFASELFFMDAVDEDKLNYVGIPFQPTKPMEANQLNNNKKRGMSPIGWLETNVVQITDPDHIWYDPTGRTFHLFSRCHTGGVNFAAVSKVVENDDGTMTTMLETAPSGETMLFVPWPGGQMKFFVKYDPQTKLYWLLGSQTTDSMIRVDRMHPDRFNLPNQERHRLVLHFSRNLIDWCFAGLVDVGPNLNGARHYACMDIDGDDLVIMSRSGDEDARDAHNGNIITFHRVKNFRGLVY